MHYVFCVKRIFRYLEYVISTREFYMTVQISCTSFKVWCTDLFYILILKKNTIFLKQNKLGVQTCFIYCLIFSSQEYVSAKRNGSILFKNQNAWKQ